MARKSHTEVWWEANSNPALIRCTARYKSTGDRCRTEAMEGTSVCYKHGGAAPQVVAKAAVRIQMTAEKAADYMRGVLDDPNIADRDKIIAAKDLLDRAGLGAAQKHLVGVTQLDPVEQLFKDILTTPGGLADPNAEPVKAIGYDYRPDGHEEDAEWDDLLGDVVDAELVEEPIVARRTPAEIDAAANKPKPSPAKMPKHIREGLERAEQLRRLL